MGGGEGRKARVVARGHREAPDGGHLQRLQPPLLRTNPRRARAAWAIGGGLIPPPDRCVTSCTLLQKEGAPSLSSPALADGKGPGGRAQEPLGVPDEGTIRQGLIFAGVESRGETK